MTTFILCWWFVGIIISFFTASFVINFIKNLFESRHIDFYFEDKDTLF